ncbi:hypothetical protein DUI87_01508 [Hirundo rustica rustica]|uniref:ribonuclease H n=1 Tax=Hirundo rustica rustica TaxID=333673 RepID=A0A3M0L6Q9_HIRRU|nr:hypothetical protein DUI87_01508 [Hirundo rustica rustica]
MVRDIIENNASPECKRAIKALGKERPTVPEMIEACNQIGSPQHVATIQANELGKTIGEKIERALTAQAAQAETRDQKLTEILAALHLNSQQQDNTMAVMQATVTSGPCYFCKRAGHIVRNCPDIKRGATKALSTLKLTWKTDTPVWVDQWPLPDNKLSALKDLVAEQLQKGHIKPTNSPWNSPVFVIHKKTSNTWRLLQDLRKINAVIENMGPLQPGLPNLSMIPRDWPLVIIDLKDCFFNIPLHPDDAPRFAFSVPSTNLQEPLQRYHWLVLPQGMINSLTICQYFVARALSPVREQFPQSVILHYMDDLLIAAPTRKQMEMTRNCVVAEIKKSGLVISESKIQETAPWKYLGWKLTEQSITPQKIQIRTDVHTLQDLQQLLGEINWVRPVLGITADELALLFDLLKGDNDIRSPRSLTPEAHKALEEITNALQSRQAHRCVPDKPFFLAILGEKLRLCGLIFQWDSYHKDPLLIIEWVFISYRSPKTILTPLEMMSQIIIKGRARLLSIAGREFAIIYLPMKKTYFDWAMQKSEDLLYALLDFPGTCSIHYPAHKMIKAKLCYKEKPLISEEPLDAVTIFTDGSGRTHNSVITWQNKNTKTWEQDVQKVEGSPQIVELAAVVRAFQLFPEPFNLITDSAYVANVIKRIEGSVLKDVNNDKLCLWLTCLCQILSHRTNPYFISHIRAHSGLPGFMTEGNARADALASAASDEEGAASIENSTSVLAATTLPNTVEQAKLSHAFFHQNAQAIKRDFHITLEQAQNICVQKVMSKTVSSVLVVNKNGGDVGKEEAKKPYKYDCLYSENEKPVTEIELKQVASASHDRVTSYYRSEDDMSDSLEGTSTMYAQERNNNQCQRGPASSQEEARKNRVFWTVWIQWPGTTEPQKYEALVDTGAQCTLMPSGHVGTELISIAGVMGGSQQLTLLEAEVSLTRKEWQKHTVVTGPEAPSILGIDFLQNGY